MASSASPRELPALPRRVVVGYDGSEASVRAVRFALGLLRGSDDRLWIVHATDPPRSVAEPRTDEELGSESSAIEQGLRELEGGRDPTWPRLEVIVRAGRPVDVVLAVAAEVECDLIVVGTRGLRGASRLVLGSVSADVVARAGRPVTVVP